MMEKIRRLVGIYYQLQNNSAALLHYLSNKHIFSDLNLDKIQLIIFLLLDNLI